MLAGAGGDRGVENSAVVYKLGVFALDIVEFIGCAVAAGKGYGVLGQDYLRSLAYNGFFILSAGRYIGVSVGKAVVVDPD